MEVLLNSMNWSKMWAWTLERVLSYFTIHYFKHKRTTTLNLKKWCFLAHTSVFKQTCLDSCSNILRGIQNLLHCYQLLWVGLHYYYPCVFKWQGWQNCLNSQGNSGRTFVLQQNAFPANATYLNCFCNWRFTQFGLM